MEDKLYLELNGLKGTIEFNHEDKIYHGKLLNIKGLVSYEGYDFNTLIEDFYKAVWDYRNKLTQNNILK